MRVIVCDIFNASVLMPESLAHGNFQLKYVTFWADGTHKLNAIAHGMPTLDVYRCLDIREADYIRVGAEFSTFPDHMMDVYATWLDFCKFNSLRIDDVIVILNSHSVVNAPHLIYIEKLELNMM